MDRNSKNSLPRILVAWAIFFVLSVVFFITLNSLLLGLVSSLVVLVSVLFFYYPIVAVYILAVMYPFYNWVFYYNNLFSIKISVPYVDLVGLLFLVVAIFGWLVGWYKRNWRLDKKILPSLIFLIAFSLVEIVASFNSPDIASSIKYLLRPIIFGYVVYVLLPYFFIKKEEQLSNVLLFMFFSGVLVVGFSLFTSFINYGSGLFRIQPFSLWGFAPLGINHNLIAEYIIPIIPLSLVLFVWIKGVFTRKLLLLVLLLMTIVSLFTLSRAAWLSVFIPFCVVFVYLFKEKLLKKNVVFSVFLGLFILLPLLSYFAIFLSSNTVRLSNENRLLMVETASRVFAKHPLVGLGAGTFVFSVLTNTDYLNLFGVPMDAHGMGIKLIAESGILGTIFFYLLILSFLYYAVYLMKKYRNDNRRYIALFVLLSLLGNVVFQQFNTSYYISKFWFPIGISLVILRFLEEGKIKKNV